MKQTTYYSSVEKVVYEFTESEVMDALIKRLGKIGMGDWTIENCDDYDRPDDNIPNGWHIELTHHIVTDKSAEG